MFMKKIKEVTFYLRVPLFFIFYFLFRVNPFLFSFLFSFLFLFLFLPKLFLKACFCQSFFYLLRYKSLFLITHRPHWIIFRILAFLTIPASVNRFYVDHCFAFFTTAKCCVVFCHHSLVKCLGVQIQDIKSSINGVFDDFVLVVGVIETRIGNTLLNFFNKFKSFDMVRLGVKTFDMVRF